MRRIRLLQILIPIALVGLVVALVLAVRARPQRGVIPADASADLGSRMEGFRFSDLVQGRRRLLVQAKVGRVDEQGAFDVEQVERVEVDREDQSPLLLTAARGAGSGAQGKRTVRLEGGVTLRDNDANLGLEIPAVEIDQVVGTVRSLGPVKLSGQDWKGTAAAVLYSLKGEGTQISDVALEGPDGGRLLAKTAMIPAGSKDLTLDGAVEASQTGMALHAEHVVVVRGPDGRLESVTATPAVTGTASGVAGGAAGFAAQEARATWGPGGRVVGVVLAGSARIQHARGSIAAGRIDAKALEAAGATAIEAVDGVDVTGPTPKGAGHLVCEALRATLDGKGIVRDGVATGSVRFDGEGHRRRGRRGSFHLARRRRLGHAELGGRPSRADRIGTDSDRRGSHRDRRQGQQARRHRPGRIHAPPRHRRRSQRRLADVQVERSRPLRLRVARQPESRRPPDAPR
jgi:hypothetical protein